MHSLACKKGAEATTIRNRRKKLFERISRVIDNSDATNKKFIKSCIKADINELLEIERNR